MVFLIRINYILATLVSFRTAVIVYIIILKFFYSIEKEMQYLHVQSITFAINHQKINYDIVFLSFFCTTYQYNNYLCAASIMIIE